MRFISTLGHRPALQPSLVIACDDSAATSQLAGELAVHELRTRGIAIGELAATLDRELPDLVVLDGTTAAATCAWIKRARPDLPVIAIVPAESRLHAINEGADHCVTRPFDLPELVARVRVLVYHGGRRRTIDAKLDTMRLWHDWVRYLVHDLRAPLTTAMAAVSFAEAHNDATRPEHLRETMRALDDMAGLLRDILDTDRIKHGVLVPARQDVDLGELAREVAAAATSHPIEVKRSGDTRIAADAMLFRRVLTNLYANAARHAKKQPIAVDVTGGSHGVSVRVSNDGPGIELELQQHLFEPWQRFGAAGTGIGLAFCRLVCEAHEGKIWLDSGKAGEVAFAFGIPRVAKAAK